MNPAIGPFLPTNLREEPGGGVNQAPASHLMELCDIWSTSQPFWAMVSSPTKGNEDGSHFICELTSVKS